VLRLLRLRLSGGGLLPGCGACIICGGFWF
jgi:hypothetical protein